MDRLTAFNVSKGRRIALGSYTAPIDAHVPERSIRAVLPYLGVFLIGSRIDQIVCPAYAESHHHQSSQNEPERDGKDKLQEISPGITLLRIP